MSLQEPTEREVFRAMRTLYAAQWQFSAPERQHIRERLDWLSSWMLTEGTPQNDPRPTVR